jgi:Uncharacterized protein conserved in bacteria (DUF2325)
MPAFPYHVAGGLFPAPAAEADLSLTQRLVHPQPMPGNEAPVRGSRRRRLWELPHKCHCPVVGTCIAVDDLRALMTRVMVFPRETADFVLHTTAVGACAERGEFSELLQRRLEKRFAATVRRLAAARTPEALRKLWQDTMLAGAEIPGALWAAWTHPACDAQLEQEIYGDIHMIQHQVGSSVRADLGELRRLRDEGAELRRQLSATRADAEAARCEKAAGTKNLGRHIVELRAELAGRDARIANLAAQLDRLQETLPDLADRQALARRATDVDARAITLGRQVAELQSDLDRLQRRMDLAGKDAIQTADDGPAEMATESDLSGKCVLCVGGRTGAIDAYRKAVEGRGGRFLHHDGGLEESVHRIDAALAAADLVICQAGCISHNAYWRVKEQCKRTGKRCIFVKASGASGFERVVAAAGADCNGC